MELLIDATTTVHEISRTLKKIEPDRTLRQLYGHLSTHCYIIHDHASRTKEGVGANNPPVLPMLDRLESIVTKQVVYSLLGTSATTPHACLKELNKHWGILKNDTEMARINFARSSLNFGALSDQQEQFFDFLEDWEEKYAAQFPEDSSLWPKGDSLSINRQREPPYAVSNAAQSLHKALVASKNCTCQPTHDFGARLCMGTHRKPEFIQDFNFDMFLSLEQQWQEAHIRTVKEATVKFAADNSLPLPKALEKQMRVRKLCESIEKIKKTAHRLNLKVEKDKLWKLRSETSCSLIDKTKPPITLQQIIHEGALNGKIKCILAVLLSCTVLYFHETPWLQHTWGSSNILFFRTVSSTIPLKPYMQTRILHRDSQTRSKDVNCYTKQGNEACGSENCTKRNQNETDDEESDSDDTDPDDLLEHPCPFLVPLAIILLELYMSKPFTALARQYGIDLAEVQESEVSWIDADSVFRKCKLDMPGNSQFRYTVEKCLDPQTWEDSEGEKLDTQTLRTKIYEEVVWPLEDELCRAFSYIDIEELDTFAQTLDFGRYGQSMPVQHKENASPSPHPGDTDGLQDPDALGHYFDKLKDSSPRYGISTRSQTARLQHSRNGNTHHERSQFFDDEMISENHFEEQCLRYRSWKQDFELVYCRFTDKPMQNVSSPPVRIAVLDTGIDLDHPDIEARQEQIKGKYNWVNSRYKNKVPDNLGHGTHITNIVLDYVPNAEIYVAKIAGNEPPVPKIVADAIDHAVNDWKVDIITMSFGFPTRSIDGYKNLERALENAYSKHVLLFAAASNGGANMDRAYPARDQNVICVHSTDASGNRSRFSPTAILHEINFATIGEAVESSWPIHLCEESPNSPAIRYKSGTSYATPIVASMAAFLLQYARLHLTEHYVELLKRHSGMKAVLRVISRRSGRSKGRDDYDYLALSLHPDNLFGKKENAIKDTITDALDHS